MESNDAENRALIHDVFGVILPDAFGFNEEYIEVHKGNGKSNILDMSQVLSYSEFLQHDVDNYKTPG